MRLLVALAALLALLCPAFSFATTEVGQVWVRVVDADGGPVANADVELSGAFLIGGARLAKTLDTGAARFISLPPGRRYQVVVRAAGYRVVRRTGVDVEIGGTTSLKLELRRTEPDDDTEEIIITGTVPMIDAESTKIGAVLNVEQTNELPFIKNFQDLWMLVPGVTQGTADGAYNVLGSIEWGNQYLIDGMNVTNPLSNTPGLELNYDAIQAVEILTGGRDAEYGSAVGGVMNVVTRGGANEYTFTGSVLWRPDSLRLKRPGQEGSVDRRLEVNLGTGGPLIKDTLWYYVSMRAPLSWASLLEPDGGSVFPDQRGKSPPTRTDLGVRPMGKLTWQATDSTTVRLLTQATPSVVNNAQQSPTVHPDAQSRETSLDLLAVLYSESFLSANLTWDNRVGLWWERTTDRPASGDLDTPSHYNSATGADTVNYWLIYDSVSARVQLHSALNLYVEELLGEHQFKAGIDVSLMRHDTVYDYPGGRTFTDDGLDPRDPGSVSGVGLPDEMTVVVESTDGRDTGDSGSLYVQDVWKPLSNLTVRPGLRFDSVRMRNWQGLTQLHINALSPRLGVAWDPLDEGRTQLRAGYYNYADTGILWLPFFARGNFALLRDYGYNPTNNTYDIFLSESLGPEIKQGKDYLKEPWNQRRPRTHELLAGLSQELGRDLVFSLDYIFRHNENQWEDDELNVIWNDTGDAAIGFRNGKQHYVFSLGAMQESWIRHHSVQLQLNKRLAKGWHVRASYTWSKTEGTQWGVPTSYAFDVPHNRAFERGPAPWDQRHDLLISGSYQLPYGVLLGSRMRYVSGRPYSRWYYNEFYGGFVNLRSPRGQDLDGTPLRLPASFQVMLRAMWRLEEFTGEQIEFIVDIWNLFNDDVVVGVEDRDLPAGLLRFGDVTARRPPTYVEVGLRYRL